MSDPLARHIFQANEGEDVKNVVILLHGYGANGQDLLDLAQVWATILPNTIFISPDAPFPCEYAMSGFQWFSLVDYNPDAMEQGAAEAYPILKTFVDDVRAEYKVDKVMLMGFSQGTMMALYYGLRHGEDVSGILGYSGALMGATLKVLDAQKGLPVHLVHGDADEVVPVQGTEMAYSQLKELGCAVEKTIVPELAHGIDMKGLQVGGEFLRDVIGKGA